jgi:hypothetical protein
MRRPRRAPMLARSPPRSTNQGIATMFRTTTFKRIATTAVAALAIGAGATSSALADELPITSDPNPNVIRCSWSSNEVSCMIGNTLVLCQKYSSGWYCASAQCGCSKAEEPPVDALGLRALVAEVERYVTRIAAGAAPPR